jgi:hypothetical protein
VGLGFDPLWCYWGFFLRLPTETYALRLTQPLKMSTWETPGGKGGRCVRMMTLPPKSCRMSRRSRSLNLLEPQEPHQACSRKPLSFLNVYLNIILYQLARLLYHVAPLLPQPVAQGHLRISHGDSLILICLIIKQNLQSILLRRK